jgi:hypothetical protein
MSSMNIRQHYKQQRLQKGSSDHGAESVSKGGMRITSKIPQRAERGFHRAIAGSFDQWKARQVRLARP